MSTLRSPYECRSALLRGEIVEINGKSYQMKAGFIQIGDLCFAERNQGPKVFAAYNVNVAGSWIVPSEPGPVYELSECIRIEEV